MTISAPGLEAMPTSGITGMPLPHWNGSVAVDTIRGRISLCSGSVPTSCCQRFPVAASTSSMP